MKFLNGHRYIRSINDIPDGEWWIVVQNESVFIPGDERSRTNPGHGYGASTQSYITMLLFENKGALEGWMRLQSNCRNKEYKVLHVRTPRITTETIIDIE